MFRNILIQQIPSLPAPPNPLQKMTRRLCRSPALNGQRFKNQRGDLGGRKDGKPKSNLEFEIPEGHTLDDHHLLLELCGWWLYLVNQLQRQARLTMVDSSKKIFFIHEKKMNYDYWKNFLFQSGVSDSKDVGIVQVRQAYPFSFGGWDIPLGTHWLESLLGFEKAKPALYMDRSAVLLQLLLPGRGSCQQT